MAGVVAANCVGRSTWAGPGCMFYCNNAAFGDPLPGVPKKVCTVQLMCTVQTKACDDGNAQSGDGCSAACAVEEGFVCRGGNATTRDACVAWYSACECGNVLTWRASGGAGAAAAGAAACFDYCTGAAAASCGDHPESGRSWRAVDDDIWSMQAVYISLKRHAERRAALLPQLQAAGFCGAKHFVAVDGWANPLLTSALLLARLITPHAAESLFPGQKGVLASHAAVWRQAVMRARHLDEWLFVFEDDVRFHPLCTPQELERRWGTLPLDAWFVKLAYLDNSWTSRAARPCNKDWHSLRYNTLSFMAYAVRLDAVHKLLQHTWNGPMDTEMPVREGVYGAASFAQEPAFYSYFNPGSGRNELFHGVCGVAPVESTTSVAGTGRLS
jgi:cysteine-rich repeat protein